MTDFTGTGQYVATRELQVAVNAAVTLQKPLLGKGEPGTGKTLLAFEVAAALGKPLITWHVKSSTTAQQGLYQYDAVSRLRDSQLGLDVTGVSPYIRKGKRWEAFADEQTVLLIDEIDKADIEFPNDLLNELDRMEFYCYELRRPIRARHRPIIVITSNNEKELPDAFLRRCFFHFIAFPDRETMHQIVQVHFPNLKKIARRGHAAIFQHPRGEGIKEKSPRPANCSTGSGRCSGVGFRPICSKNSRPTPRFRPTLVPSSKMNRTTNPTPPSGPKQGVFHLKS